MSSHSRKALDRAFEGFVKDDRDHLRDLAVARGWIRPDQGTESLTPEQHRELRRECNERAYADLHTEVPPEAMSATETIDSYALVKEVGQGGMGRVWKAWDRKLSRWVAVKILREESSDELKARFLREVKTTAGLGHPNIVTVLDGGEVNGRPYMVMELIEGRPFDPRRPLKEILPLLQTTASALDEAHKRGVVHRDLKPSNILIDIRQRPRIVDFGLAHLLNERERLTRTRGIIGTPLYMAPEQVSDRSGDVSPRTDVYALGVLLYESITGRTPHQGDSTVKLCRAIAEEDPPRPRELISSIPADLETICLRAIEKDPGRRFESAARLADDIGRYLRGEPIDARPTNFGYRMARFVARRKALVLAGVGGVVLAALVAAFTVPGWMKAAKERSEGEARLNEQRKKNESLARARPHVLEARKYLSELDRLMSTPDATPERREELAERARKRLRLALREHENHAEALLEWSRSCRLIRDRDGAIEYCTKAIAADPELTNARLERALLRMLRYQWMRVDDRGLRVEETPEAARLREAIQSDLDPSSGEERELVDAMLAFSQGRMEEATNRLQKYAESRSGDPRGWHWAAHAWHFRGGFPDRVIQAANRALQFRFEDPNMLLLRGAAYVETQLWNEAVQDMTTLVRLRPGDARCYSIRSYARLRLKRMRAAMNDSNEAIRLNPRLVEAWQHRGRIFLENSNPREAVNCFRRAVHLDDRSPVSFIGLGEALFLLGDFREAESSFGRAIQNDPGHELAFTRRGETRHRQRNSKGAMEDYSEAIRLNPKNATSYKDRALLHVEAGRFDEAEEDLEAALELQPDLVGAHLIRAELRLNQKRPDEAIASCRLVLEREKLHAGAYLRLARAHHQKREGDKVLLYGRKALQLAPRGWPWEATLRRIMKRYE